MLLKRLLEAAFGQLIDPLEDGLDAAEVLHQLGRGLVADAGDARDVVGGVAAKRLEVDQLRRLETVPLSDLVRSVYKGVGDTAAWHERLDRFGHQLQAVEVARHDRDGVTALLTDARERADDVVRLEALDRVDRDRERLEDLAHLLDLRAQVVRHGAPAGLVLLVLLRPKSGGRQVERGSRELRAGGQDDREHGCESVHGIGHLPVRRAHRRQCEKRPVDEAVGVDQNQAPALPLRHVWILRTPWRQPRRPGDLKQGGGKMPPG